MVENTITTTRACRLLYYGTAGVGKRENLAIVHRTIPPESRLNLAVEDPERQIAFTYNQPGGGVWQVLVQTVDVGHERLRSAGMSERPPFDAVVFTVDSGAAHLDQSLSAFEALKNYLESWGRDLMDVPVVIQYNRRGTPDALPVDRLESLLNPWGLLSYPADSARGEGVRETLKSILGLAVNHLKSLPESETEPVIKPEAVLVAPSAPPPKAVAVPPPPVAPPKAVAAPPPPAPPPKAVATPPPPAQETRPAVDSIELDYSPPVPGTEVETSTLDRQNALMDGLRPPIIVPVRIPRRLLESEGPVQVQLEITVGDDDRF